MLDYNMLYSKLIYYNVINMIYYTILYYNIT